MTVRSLLPISLGVVLLVGFACGCQPAEPEVNRQASKAPPEIQDLKTNPAVPPAQAAYLMSGGKDKGNERK